MESEYFSRFFKIVLHGEPGSGKTAFLANINKQSFVQKYKPTIGIDIVQKNLFDDASGH